MDVDVTATASQDNTKEILEHNGNVGEDEDESDDELFPGGEPPNLIDDDDEDEEDVIGERENNNNNNPNANCVEEEDENSNSQPAHILNIDDDTANTYGSPGLREVFNEDEDSNKAATPDLIHNAAGSSRRNKRKNFKPRNINSDSNEVEAAATATAAAASASIAVAAAAAAAAAAATANTSQSPLNLSSSNQGEDSSSPFLQRKSLMPRRLEKGGDPGQSGSSPMDLSTTSNPDEDERLDIGDSNLVEEEEEDEDENSSRPGLSVVRPEILFGSRQQQEQQQQQQQQQEVEEHPQPTPDSKRSPLTAPTLGFPPLLAGLAGLGGFGNNKLGPLGLPGLGQFGAQMPGGPAAMKQAFQEVLKLYGVPSEIAETIAKNAQHAQGNEQAPISR